MKHPGILSDVLELHYVELRKFKPSKPSELRTRFERWLYFLKFADLFGPEDQTLPENLAQEKGIAMALESMRRAYAKDPVREMIEAREKAEADTERSPGLLSRGCWWRWRESNPRPRRILPKNLRAYLRF